MKPHHRIADLFSLFILLILLVLFLSVSPLGLRLIASLGNALDVGLEIQGVNGTLLRGLEIESLAWNEMNGTGIELKKVKLNFKKTIYSNDVFNIKNLSASALNIYIPPSDLKKKNNEHVIIPHIPIPVDMVADHVQLDTLRIIRDRKELLFKIDDMAVTKVSILDNQLLAENAIATPIIWGAPFIASVDNVSLSFDQPHAMSGRGEFKYSHIQTGDFIGEVQIGGTLTNYQAEGTIDWDEAMLGQSMVTFKGFGDYHKATFSSVHLEHSEGALQATGGIAWIDKFSWKANVQGNDVHTQQFSPQWPAVIDLLLSTQGEYVYADDKWQLDIDLDSLEGEVEGFPIKASGLITLKDSILRAKKLSVKTDKNRILLEGRITEPFRLKWDINAKNIGQLLPGYSGSIVGKGLARGTTIEPTGSGKLKIRGFNGEGIKIDHVDIDLQAGSNDSLLSGKGRAKIKNAEFEDFKIGTADINFTGGSGGGLLSGKGKAKINNFQFQDYKVVSADIDFDGKEKASLLEGKGNIRLKQLTSQKMDLASASFNFDGSEKSLNIKGKVKKLKVAGQVIDSGQLDTTGTLENHRLKLVGKSKQGNLVLNAKGGWLDSKWKGTIQKINMTKTETGDWSLKKSVHIDAASDAFTGSEICITNPKRGQLCMDTQWSVLSGLTSKGALMRIPLSQLKPWLPDNLDLTGVVNGTFNLKQKEQGIYGDAEFRLPDSVVIVENTEGKKEKVAYHDGKVKLKFTGKKVETNISITIDRKGKFTSTSTITLAPITKKHLIQGEANFDVTDLNWAQEFFPDIAKLKGKITSKVRFQGLLEKPKYSGEIELKNGQLSIPDTGTNLTNITLLIKTTKPNQAVINGSLNTGSAKLLVDGTMKINKLNDWVAELNLKGKNLLFMNTHEVQAFASPDLHLKVTPGLAHIKGNFHIPKARIKLSELPETAIYESDDVVFVRDKKKGEQEKPLRILPNVTISLGENISFDGFGLKAKLKGKFHVIHNHNAIVSRGTLRIKDGQYTAYGQRLKIEHGVLVFHGPIHNPGLDIRATRSIDGDDINVGINLAGTLQKPKSSIFSDPPQSESDALSYLITGQSLSETSGDQAQLLLQAVRTLGINSGSTMLNRIGGSVGLDDLNIITYADYKKNKLQLGKRLGPNLYIRYITGLFDTFHQIAVDYKLGSKWSLQAESGEAQGIDFIYNIDTN